MSELPDLEGFAKRLTERSVEYRDEPFRLRGGGLSHWYVDLHHGLSHGDDLKEGGKLLAARFRDAGVTYMTIGGIGVCGRALVPPTAMATSEFTHMSWATMILRTRIC